MGSLIELAGGTVAFTVGPQVNCTEIVASATAVLLNRRFAGLANFVRVGTNDCTLKAGGSRIQLTPDGIKIHGKQIEVEADVLVAESAPMLNRQVDGKLTIKSSLRQAQELTLQSR